ncbi:uncharacterized protein NPIL_454391 [Nephila pilipes]|uniref:Gustatory receptor n=1 Tax=Nephila pilipes TaxID=299642 RepID=A0A8X6UBV3_NEPPI|nr:uncharacterized protein NPIL_454391 [Nephila pilipes]
MCLLIDEKLKAIKQSLDFVPLPDITIISQIRKQQKLFCALQKLSAECNDVFTEIIFLWILKIVLKTCSNAYDLIMLLYVFEDVGMLLGNLMEITYDISHLAVICVYAGRITENKTEILDRLVELCGLKHNIKGHSIKDIHLFVSIIGHSNMALTVWNIFPLTKNTAITILSGIVSYSVIIYQLSKRE